MAKVRLKKLSKNISISVIMSLISGNIMYLYFFDFLIFGYSLLFLISCNNEGKVKTFERFNL